MDAQLRYKGRNRSGTAVGGVKAADGLADWVAWKYRAGWQALTVLRGDTEVAGIGAHPDDGRRIWWSEGCEGQFPR
jgi:hypothetical protein